jgi:hypothetical protein
LGFTDKATVEEMFMSEAAEMEAAMSPGTFAKASLAD